MSCLFSFRRQKRSIHKHVYTNNNNHRSNRSNHNNPKSSKKKNYERPEQQQQQQNLNIRIHHFNDDHNNSSKKTTTVNSQSTGTKSSTTISNPIGVPSEIGGMSFDVCDEVSLISCSTLRNNPSFSFDEPGNGAVRGGLKSQQRYNDWVKNGSDVKAHTPSANRRYLKSKNTNLLAAREGEDEDSSDIDNESKSHFTRVSI